MKHPTEEQWMELLYDELPREMKSELEAHLGQCAACRQKRARYSATQQRLDQWVLPAPSQMRLRERGWSAAKWAAAAALLVSTAFATGRISKGTFDPQRIQAEIRDPLERQISHSLEAQLHEQVQLAAERAFESARLKVQAEMAARLQEISERSATETAANKEQLALTLSALRDQDHTLYAALKEFETKQQTDNQAIREDLEKLALFTDHSLRSAQRQLVQLASFNEIPNTQQ